MKTEIDALHQLFHDLLGPLAVAQGATELLGAADLPPVAQEDLQVASTALEQLHRTVVSAQKALEPAPFREGREMTLNQLLRGAGTRFPSEKASTWFPEMILNEDWRVKTDPEVWTDVVLGLVSLALKVGDEASWQVKESSMGYKLTLFVRLSPAWEGEEARIERKHYLREEWAPEVFVDFGFPALKAMAASLGLILSLSSRGKTLDLKLDTPR